MEQVIWIEILSRHGGLLARHRFAGPEVRIGRGYANDLVLDDPAVAAQHVRVFRDESGALVAEDIGSANGMFVDRRPDKVERVALDGERIIRIGHSYLRVRDASHPVARERPLAPQYRFWPAALGGGAALLAFKALLLWIGETGDPKVSSYIFSLLGIAASVAAWAAAWSVLGRVFSGRARFERHLAVALAGALALSLYQFFADTAAFTLAWYRVASDAYVATYTIAGAVCFGHLRVIGPSRLAIKASVVALLALIAVAAQMLAQSEARAEAGRQDFARNFLPPALRLKPLVSENAFFADVERLMGDLDRDSLHGGPAADENPLRGPED